MDRWLLGYAVYLCSIPDGMIIRIMGVMNETSRLLVRYLLFFLAFFSLSGIDAFVVPDLDRRLPEKEVLEIAAGAATKHGYKLEEYEAPRKPRYGAERRRYL